MNIQPHHFDPQSSSTPLAGALLLALLADRGKTMQWARSPVTPDSPSG